MKVITNIQLLVFILFMGIGTAFCQQCNIIYVSPTGASTGVAGTSSNPATLNYALTLITPTSNQLWLEVGTYNISQTISIPSDVTIEGGFDGSTWTKSSKDESIIHKDGSNVQLNPDRLIAISAQNVNGFNLHDLTIIVDDASGNGASCYGIHVDNCFNYRLTRLIIQTGNGTDGLPGTLGTNGVNGVDGSAGQNGDEDGGCCTGGGAGGVGSYPGSVAGGTGGTGGARGSFSNAPDGIAGNPGAGTLGGTPGNGGTGYDSWGLSFGCDATPANWGGIGAMGGNGLLGADGLDGVPAFAQFFMPGTGLNGQQGEHGSGGGGGGGGGSQGGLITWPVNNNGSGPGGGGGGEGGEGGFGASGGTGGGGSFGIYVFGNGAGTYIKDAEINAGMPGMGGLGGFPGGLGGNGGNGGNGGGPGCDIGTGGDGGDGGNGGSGGAGGDGSPGVSLNVFEDPAGVTANQTNMRSVVEPEIFVINTGCTWSDIELSTNASGIVEWFFDGGSVPLSASGSTATVQYATTGRHSITLVVNGLPYIYSDFVGIFNDGTPYLPTILASSDTICPGDNITFSSSYPGLTYDWTVEDNGISAFTTPTVNHTFNDVGTYEVTLQTSSPCCGKSKIDTFLLYVVPYQTPDVFVTASSSTICDGETVSFGAISVYGGSSPQYQWQLNSTNIVGETTPSYSTSNLNNGDVVTCIMVSNYQCVNGSNVTSDPIAITVNPLPIFTCSSIGSYLGGTTSLTANPGTGTPPFNYNWDFGDGGSASGVVVNHLYGGTGTYNYSVTVTDAMGCSGTCTNSLTISVAPPVVAGFTTTTNIISCGNTQVVFQDTTSGGPVFWEWDLGDGTTSQAQNPAHTYNSPGLYSVTLITGNGVNNDTVVYPNYIQVLFAPTVGLGSVNPTGCEPHRVQFMDESIGAVQWQWTFGDGSTSNAQNPDHLYPNAGVYDVSLVVTSSDGCTDSIYMPAYVNVVTSPVADFITSDSSLCGETPVKFTDMSLGATSWYWDFGDGTQDSVSQNPGHVYTESGNYYVSLIVSNTFGCTDTMNLNSPIMIRPYPHVDFVPSDYAIQLPYTEVSFTNWSYNYTSFLWDFDNGVVDSITINPSMEFPDSGTYHINLSATNELGCTEDTTIDIHVIELPVFFIPNSFTPDDNGRNDVFKIEGNGINNLELWIFNRWGDVVFYTDDKYQSWDGKVNNRLVPEGVYVYLLEIELIHPTYYQDGSFERYAQKKYVKNGNIHLLRKR